MTAPIKDVKFTSTCILILSSAQSYMNVNVAPSSALGGTLLFHEDPIRSAFGMPNASVHVLDTCDFVKTEFRPSF